MTYDRERKKGGEGEREGGREGEREGGRKEGREEASQRAQWGQGAKVSSNAGVPPRGVAEGQRAQPAVISQRRGRAAQPS